MVKNKLGIKITMNHNIEELNNMNKYQIAAYMDGLVDIYGKILVKNKFREIFDFYENVFPLLNKDRQDDVEKRIVYILNNDGDLLASKNHNILFLGEKWFSRKLNSSSHDEEVDGISFAIEKLFSKKDDLLINSDLEKINAHKLINELRKKDAKNYLEKREVSFFNELLDENISFPHLDKKSIKGMSSLLKNIKIEPITENNINLLLKPQIYKNISSLLNNFGVSKILGNEELQEKAGEYLLNYNNYSYLFFKGGNNGLSEFVKEYACLTSYPLIKSEKLKAFGFLMDIMVYNEDDTQLHSLRDIEWIEKFINDKNISPESLMYAKNSETYKVVKNMVGFLKNDSTLDILKTKREKNLLLNSLSSKTQNLHIDVLKKRI